MNVTVSKTVRLGELDHDPVIMAMPGQAERLKQIDDLKASIPAHGLLQGLKVRIDAGGTRYLVTAGNRRLAALRWLQDHGGEIRGERVHDGFPVHVILSEESDDAAREQSVAENIQRVAPTVVAEIRQYAALATQASPKEIAARFGVPVKRVEQRLKLAHLHEDILAALDAGEISIGAAEAFTVEPDPKRQSKHLGKVLGKQWELDPKRIREALTDKLVDGAGTQAKIIGLEAYVAAGGQVIDDPFTGGTWWTSTAIVEDLLEKHWAARTAEWTAAGWAFVAEVTEYGNYMGFGDWNCVAGDKPDSGLTGEGFTAEQRAGTGVVYAVDGRRAPHFGFIDRKKATPTASSEKAAKPQEVAADLNYPGVGIASELRGARAQAVRARLAASPLLALRVLVASLHAGMVCGEDFYWGPIGIAGEQADDVPWDVDDDDLEEGEERPQPPLQGRNYAEALEWARGAEEHELVAYLGELTAESVGWGHGNYGDLATTLIDFLEVDPVFDADAYFGAVTKPLVLLAWEDMTGEKLKAKGDKEALASLVAEKASETGWLPPQLRTSKYAGPCFVTAKAADVEPDDEDDEEFVEDELAEAAE